MSLRLEPIGYETELFAPMLADAEVEQLAFLARLRDEWQSGVLGFERYEAPDATHRMLFEAR
jgi:hypothetical protein